MVAKLREGNHTDEHRFWKDHGEIPFLMKIMVAEHVDRAPDMSLSRLTNEVRVRTSSLRTTVTSTIFTYLPLGTLTGRLVAILGHPYSYLHDAMNRALA